MESTMFDLNDEKIIQEIISNTLPFVCDKKGSESLQYIYEYYQEHREEIFKRIEPDFAEISKSEYGNYLIQKIIKIDPDKKLKIFSKLKDNILEFCKNKYGTYIIQALIENLSFDCLVEIYRKLKGHFVELIKDQSGNRVVQQLIENQSKEQNKKIFEEIKNNLIELSKNTYGCYTIQKLLKNCDDDVYEEIIKEVFNNANELIQDETGHYLIQYFLKAATEKDRNNLDKIYPAIQGKIFEYSMDKIRAHIIEGALKYGNQLQRKNIIKEILELDKVKEDCLASLSVNAYGNYVVKLLLNYADKEEQIYMVKKILSDPYIKRGVGKSKYIVDYIKYLNVLLKGAFDNLL